MKRLLLILAGLLYLLWPYDLIPDFFVGIGWLEDVVILGLLWWYLSQLGKRSRYYRYGYEQAGAGYSSGEAKGGEGGYQGQQGRPNHGTRARKDPYEILGVTRDATKEEIKSAYRSLASKYHPDKVSHLGDEFKELAEKRFKEIKDAYERLMGSA